MEYLVLWQFWWFWFISSTMLYNQGKKAFSHFYSGSLCILASFPTFLLSDCPDQRHPYCNLQSPVFRNLMQMSFFWTHRKTNMHNYFFSISIYKHVCLTSSYTDKIACHLLTAGSREAPVVTWWAPVPFSLITASKTECMHPLSFSSVTSGIHDGLLLQMSFP